MRVVAVKRKEADLAKQASGRRNATPAVEVAEAGPRTIESTLDVVGDAESPNVARLAPKVTGPITFLQVREGDAVTQGQVLVRIDPREVEAGVSAAQAAVAEAQARLAQAQATAQSTLVGIEGSITGGQAGVATAAAGLNQAQRNQAAQIAAAQATVANFTAQISAANADVRSALADVTAAEANLNNARIKLERTLQLYKGGYIAAQDVDDAKAVVKVQEGALAVAQATV
ncbi:biotin/lipoyl-binding protein, partial [bacterium]